MKNKQKRMRAAAWITVCLLCIFTISVFSAGAETPTRSLIHLRIKAVDMYKYQTSIHSVPVNPSDDPDNPDGGTFENVLMIASSSSGSYEIVSPYWRIYSTPYNEEEGTAYVGIEQSEEDMSWVFGLNYAPDSNASTIYCDHTGEYYDQLDIYIQPKYDYTTAPSFMSISYRDLQMITFFAECGFQFELSPYPDIAAVRQDAYSEGMLAGYDDGFNAGIQQGGGGSGGSYDQGYNDGFQAGQDDITQSKTTLLDFVGAIFSAPGYLINTIFDFDLFGFNMAGVIKVLVTLVIVGFVVGFFLKKGVG